MNPKRLLPALLLGLGLTMALLWLPALSAKPRAEGGHSGPAHATVTSTGFDLSKSVFPAGNVAAGGVLRYTMAYANTGGVPATNVVITDALPLHTTLSSVQDGGVYGNGIVSWAVGSVPPGGSGAVHFRVQVDQPLGTGTPITNVAHLRSDQTGPLESNVTTNVVALMPDFGLSYKRVTSVYPAKPGDLLTYTIVYTNGGTLDGLDVVITDPVPAHTTYVTGGVYAGGVVRFDLGGVDAGTGGSVAFTTRIDESTPVGVVITNAATIVSHDTPPLTTDAVTTMVIAPALTLHKAVTPTGGVPPNTTLTYTLTYTNSGNLDATGVLVTEALPPGLAYLSGGDSWDGEAVRWGIGTLPISASGQVTFTAWVTDGVGSVHNRADLYSDQRGLQLSNVVTTPVLMPVFQIVKTVSPTGTASPNELLAYTLCYTNVGAIAATAAVLLDPLPDGVEYVSGGIYVQSTHAVSFPLGTVPAGESDSRGLTVRVRAPQGTVIADVAQMFYDELYPAPYVSDVPLDVSGSLPFGPIGGANGLDYVAQSFVATAPRLNRAGIYIYGRTLPYPDVRVQLWGDAAGWPDATNVLLVGDVITALTPTGQRYFVHPRYPITLTVGTRYWLVIDGLLDTSSPGNVGTKYAASNPYPDGSWAYSENGGTDWTMIQTTDLNVRVEYVPPPHSNAVTTTIVNRSPYTPTNPTPPDGASGVPLMPALGWQGGDPDGDAVTYTVALGSSTPPPVVTTTITTTTYAPGALQPYTRYYWAITTTDGLSLTAGGVWTFTTAAPPAGVTVDGPAIGVPDAAYGFTAIVSPVTATYPITYAWQATGQPPVTHTGGLSDSVTFTWSTTGTQAITVTATNVGGTVTGTHAMTVTDQAYLQIAPTALFFSAVEGGATPSPQSVAIRNDGSGQLDWSASKSAPWLSLSPLAGTAPSTLVVSVDIAGLGTGTYTDTITIDGGSQTLNSPQSVGVKLHIASGKVYLPVVVRDWPPEPPTLYSISNPGGDGNYVVSWSIAGFATHYVLEEATNDTFAGQVELYSGPNNSHVISGRGAARYYYRVKACNAWCCSGWSNVPWVDVLWEAEPNDSIEQADGPLQSGVDYFGYPNDEWDFFSVYLDTAGQIIVDLTNHTGRGVQLLLYDQDGVLRGRDWEPPPYHVEYTGGAGWYSVRIYIADDTSYNSDTPYTLRTTFP